MRPFSPILKEMHKGERPLLNGFWLTSPPPSFIYFCQILGLCISDGYFVRIFSSSTPYRTEGSVHRMLSDVDVRVFVKLLTPDYLEVRSGQLIGSSIHPSSRSGFFFSSQHCKNTCLVCHPTPPPPSFVFSQEGFHLENFCLTRCEVSYIN